MRRTSFAFLVLFLTLATAACGPGGRGSGGDGGSNNPDADPHMVIDADINPFGDADIVPDGGLCGDNACANPVDDLCGDTEICSNGIDDDCDGHVEEDCPCSAGAVQACFQGQPGRRNIGSCVDGTQRCQGDGEFAVWGECEGGISPHGEACDSQDNNCNGCADDHPDCCTVELHCPGPGDMPDGTPFEVYNINGTDFYAGTVQSWQWTVTGGPCDQLLAPSVSFTLTGQNTNTLHFTPTLSGDYTVRVRMTLPGGVIQECEFIVHVGGPGLRVEACWDTDGSADIDLAVHRPDSTTNWLVTTPDATAFNTDDCNYGTCTADAWFGGTPANWGLANSPLAECENTDNGFIWGFVGFCANPRLDIDNIATVGKPENINIDKPVNGKTYRVAVHYYGGSVATHPLVNVYCGGKLLGTYGAAPDTISGFGSSGDGGGYGPWWRVVDVTPAVDGTGVTTGCDLAPLHPPGQTDGNFITCPMPGSPTTCFDTSY